MRFEHVYEVDPSLMELTGQQPMPAWDTQRIVDGRWDYLDWMHDHFADEVILAGEESETMEEERVMGENGMRWSFCMLPDYPLEECVDTIKTADELGFYAAYSVDETWHKDPWVLFAAAADKTERIRFGPNVTHVFLREPTLICQQIATLDELTNGRMELIVSTGNFGLLSQYGIDWANQKPLSRLKEAIHVMRTFLADGAITFEGDFFQYNGLYTFARPVQEPIPIKMGAMKGPRSFQAAGELTDGVHHALSYSREAYDYMAEHTAIGAEKAGRDVQDARPRRVGRDGRLRGLGGGQARGAHPGRVLRLLDAAGAARSATASTRPSCSRWSMRSAPATSRRRSRRSRPSTPRSSRSRGRPRSAWRRSRPTCSRPASTT